MTKSMIKLVLTLLVVAPVILSGQVVVGSGSAALDIQGSTGGMLLPRLTTTERNSISAPAAGLMIFNTSTLCIEVNHGSSSSPEWAQVQCRNGSVSQIVCGSATVTGTLTRSQAASGVSISVPYTGGNAGFYAAQTINSTGVTGITATLAAGNLGSGAGNLSYAITGTPASGGTASFALNIGGQNCTLNVAVTNICSAKVTATDYKNFLCHNLGAANTSADPFTPSWEINGGYWQWGRLAQAAAGPTGSGSSQANDGAIGGWNTTIAANGSWSDGTKTANDPCPAGYRVPTKAQWDGVTNPAYNTLTFVGTFNNLATNYSAGIKFGNQLMLPAAGNRFNNDGALDYRGNFGLYWSSTESGSFDAWGLNFNSSNAGTSSSSRTFGRSVRCVAE